MSGYKVYDSWEYRINDRLLGDEEPEGNRLLDDDGEPATYLTGSSTAGLAAIASAIHKHASTMQPEHLEKAVWWLKDWKANRAGWYRKMDDLHTFAKTLQSLKTKPEFLADGRSARRYSLGSHMVALMAGIAFAITLNAWLDGGSWGAKIGWGIGTLLFAAITSALRDTARDIWQRQDRRYFLQCLRQARCTEDLLDAGLFSHHPATDNVSNAKGYIDSRHALREMQSQMGDALYFDWDHNIRERFNEQEQANSWNWPTSSPTKLKTSP